MRVTILGNSGSGKSTLARELGASATPILDLDTIVWQPGQIAVPRPLERVDGDLDAFCAEHAAWLVEGCYGRLAARTLRYQPELIFVNPGEAVCLRNCRSRPWEPHKYASKDDQDAKLALLLAWVSDYYRRDDDMSLVRHRAIFDGYRGPKRELRSG